MINKSIKYDHSAVLTYPDGASVSLVPIDKNKTLAILRGFCVYKACCLRIHFLALSFNNKTTTTVLLF